MSETSHRLMIEDDVQAVLTTLAHIAPNAGNNSLIPVTTEISVPLQHYRADSPDGQLNLRGTIVKVTQVDHRGNPALFSVYKGDGGRPLAVVKPAKPAEYSCRLEFSDAAVSRRVVTLGAAA